MWRSEAQWITHRDVMEEFEKLGLPRHWVEEADLQLRDKYFKRYGKHRERIFHQHLATLTSEERSNLKAGKHPSQSHDLADAALRYADDLLMELRSRGVVFVEGVRLGYYHGDRIVLTIVISERTPDAEVAVSLPFYFKGFETRCSRHKMAPLLHSRK